jgi:23S rRNA pseudouridine1911/1915/1917 synthase
MIDEEVPAALGGERVDRIVSLLAGVSRKEAASLVAAGGVHLDGVVVATGKQRVEAGQRITIDPDVVPDRAPPTPEPSVDVPVVHVDDAVIVVDKPAGLVVHPAPGHRGGTLVNGLLARFPELAGVGEPDRPGIVHRLDAGTSGLMVVARTDAAYAQLVADLAARRVEREYEALVWSWPEQAAGIIDAPIGRDPRDPLRMAVTVDGRPARTHFSVVERYVRPSELALLHCRLETGRTHQIRVHLSAVGHPVVGDGPYQGVRPSLRCPRPFLHAARLSFTHPVTGAALAFTSALPADLAEVLAACTPLASGPRK